MFSLRRMFPAVVAAAVLVVAALPIIWFVGSSNPYTPAGYVGYLTRGAVF